MRREKCKFCGCVLEGLPEGYVFRYKLGAKKLVHCGDWMCRGRGKEWRVARLKECAEALGLARKPADSPVSQLTE